MGQHQQDGQTSLLTVLREAYLGRSTGRISIDDGFEIYVRRGEVFFDRDHDLVSGLGPLVARAGSLDRPLADAEMRSAVKTLSATLFGESSSWTGARWSDEAPKGVELVGPFPAIGVLLEGATYGADEARLLKRLGGESTRFKSRDDSPAMNQLPGLDGDMARVLVLLEQPTTVADVLRGGGDRAATLAGLAKLWAIGLAEGPKSTASGGDDSVVSPKILDRFLARIGEVLELEPSTLEPTDHRGKLARLIGRFGDLDHYQLLGVEATADDAAISAGYNRLARLAHPSHAAALGWTGKEATLRLLFERATEAYLTLCDPLRRSSYNTLMGVHRQLEIDPSTRDEEKRFMARQ
ncbi:MAG: DnaJ domain-containing protein, partial [Acidobacteriota bacterium]